VGQGLRNVGGNIRDGITGFSGSVMSKPREFAHLIKNKFGSADNINQMSEAELQGMQSANADVLGSERLQQVPGAGTSTGSGGGGQNNNTALFFLFVYLSLRLTHRLLSSCQSKVK